VLKAVIKVTKTVFVYFKELPAGWCTALTFQIESYVLTAFRTSVTFANSDDSVASFVSTNLLLAAVEVCSGVAVALLVRSKLRKQLSSSDREHLERTMTIFEIDQFTSSAAEHAAINITFVYMIAASIAPLGQGGKDVPELGWVFTSYVVATTTELTSDVLSLLAVMWLLPVRPLNALSMPGQSAKFRRLNWLVTIGIISNILMGFYPVRSHCATCGSFDVARCHSPALLS